MKRTLSIILAVVMLLSILPLSAFATDDREVIPIVEATSNWRDFAVYGGSAQTVPTFSVTKGSPAFFETRMQHWNKVTSEGNIRYNDATFTEGTYLYSIQVRVENPNYRINESTKFIINGEEWSNTGGYDADGDTIAYMYAWSPQVTIEKQAIPLAFNTTGSYNIPVNFIGVPITSYSVAGGAAGGEEPYTFSKTSGPAWINVLADGTVSGTPTTYGSNENLVVRVTDNSSDYKEISIPVNYTYKNPADRTVVSKVEITSNISDIIGYGKATSKVTFTVNSGAPAYLENNTAHWYIVEGEAYSRADNTTFDEGTYFYSLQLRIDGSNGREYVLDRDAEVIVDGVKWEYVNPIVKDDYSYGYIRSPRYDVHLMPLIAVEAKDPTCVDEGNNAYYKCDACGKCFKDAVATQPTTPEAETLAPTGHDYKANVVAPKANALGYTQYKCDCGDLKKDEAGNIIKENFTVPTGKPSGLKCSSRAATSEKFTWAKTSGVSGYQLQISTKDGKKWDKTYNAKTATSYTVKGLTAGSAYKVRVRFYITKNGKNYYGAWATLTSPTLPKGTVLSKVTPAKKSFTAQWKKNKAVTGYQLQYSLKSNFSGAKSKAIKGASKLKLTIKSLQGGKKYFVRVRTYKTIAGKTYYSTWSKAKTVTTKK